MNIEIISTVTGIIGVVVGLCIKSLFKFLKWRLLKKQYCEGKNCGIKLKPEWIIDVFYENNKIKKIRKCPRCLTLEPIYKVLIRAISPTKKKEKDNKNDIFIDWKICWNLVEEISDKNLLKQNIKQIEIFQKLQKVVKQLKWFLAKHSTFNEIIWKNGTHKISKKQVIELISFFSKIIESFKKNKIKKNKIDH